MFPVAYSDIYKYQLPEGHRFPMEKYELLPEQLVYEGTVSPSDFFHPNALSDAEILLTHEPGYLNKLQNLSLTRKEERNIGFPVRENLILRGRYIAHGTYQCGLYARQYGVALNIAGGTHHAYPHKGEGFCVLNDISIASNLMLERGEAERILIIDLDVHQGNGNAFIFRNEPRVFTFSMHGERNYPLRKEKSDLDIALPDGTTDSHYLDTLTESLPPVIDFFCPDMIYYQAGVDVLGTDKLGRLNLTPEGCRQRDRFVFETARKNNVPIAVTMGGGYSHKLSHIIDAHAQTFREARYVYF